MSSRTTIAALVLAGASSFLLDTGCSPERGDGENPPGARRHGDTGARDDVSADRKDAPGTKEEETALEALDRRLSSLEFGGPGFWGQPQAEETLRLALETAARFRDYRRLEAFASEMVKRQPSDPGGLLALGVARHHLGEYASAESLIRRCLGAGSGSPSTLETARLELGLALAKQGRHREALEELARLLVENPYQRRAYLELGRSLSRLGRIRAARDVFTRAQALAPADGEDERADDHEAAGRPLLAARYRARACALRGRFAAAERILRDAAADGSPGALVYLAEHLVATLQSRGVRVVLRELGERVGPSHPDVRGWTAMSLDLEGKPEEAAAGLSALLDEHRRLVPVWAPRLARILLEELSAPDAAREWLEIYRRTDPNVESGILLARALLGTGAAEAATRILASLSHLDAAWEERAGDVWLARCRLRAGGDIERAGKTLASIAEGHRRRPEYHLALAEYLEAASEAAPSPDAAEKIRGARREAARLSALRDHHRALIRRAARGRDENQATTLFCDAAEVSFRMGDRDRAVQLARIAASFESGLSRPWALLDDWLDRPGEIFLRAEARRRRAALGPGFDTTLALTKILELFLSP